MFFSHHFIQLFYEVIDAVLTERAWPPVHMKIQI